MITDFWAGPTLWHFQEAQAEQLKKADTRHPGVATSPFSFFLSSECLDQASGSVPEKVRDTPFSSELHV